MFRKSSGGSLGLRTRRDAIALEAVAVFLGTAPHAAAQAWSFARIADTNTTVPASSSLFATFGIPSIGDGVVGFAGFNVSLSEAGVYLGSGGALSVVADRHTLSPGGTNFVGFAQGSAVSPSIAAGQVAFTAGDGIEGGIFLKTQAAIIPVATTLIPVPNGGGNFSVTGTPSLQNGRVAFYGGESGLAQSGIYSWHGGSVSIIADHATPIPAGSGTFTSFADASLDAGLVAFKGSGDGGQQGIYLADGGGTIQRLYDRGTVVPGGPGGTFDVLARVALSQGSVVFYGNGAAQEGIYSDVGGSLAAIADHSTAVPGHPGQHFVGFGLAAIDDGIVALTGIFAGANRGVFSTHGGSLGKVLAWGDTLDGKVVLDTLIGTQGLDGNSLALYVEFTDGSKGIYMATIPAPGAVALLSVAGLFAARRTRRPCYVPAVEA